MDREPFGPTCIVKAGAAQHLEQCTAGGAPGWLADRCERRVLSQRSQGSSGRVDHRAGYRAVVKIGRVEILI